MSEVNRLGDTPSRYEDRSWASETERLDYVASWYDARTDFDRHARRHIASLIQRNRCGVRLLEAGCGTGALTRDLTGNITAVDGSPKCIKACCEQTWNTSVKFEEALLEEYKPSGPLFEDVVMAGLLEHVKEPQLVLEQAQGWLTPDGHLHVTVPNGDSLHRRLGAEMGELPYAAAMTERDFRMGHRRVYTTREITEDLETAGWKIKSREGILLKPLSSEQMDQWPDDVINELVRVGRELPEWSAELYFLCEKQTAT
jgi:2-polyprenyl-3-methyl-5-hydroxy-6-metoxy-1,4-benzoquinol methylase